ncbi:protein kinase [bacterium]|nr:protein kinase [bacterium]
MSQFELVAMNMIAAHIALTQKLFDVQSIVDAIKTAPESESRTWYEILADRSNPNSEELEVIASNVRDIISRYKGDLGLALKACLLESAELRALYDRLSESAVDSVHRQFASTVLFEGDFSTKPAGEETEKDNTASSDGDSWKNRKLGRFRIVGRIGQGGMGVVLEGRDEEELDRRVAVKVMQPLRRNESPEALEQRRRRFENEGKIHGRLEHPNIIPIYGSGKTEGGWPFFAMRLIDSQIDMDRAIRNFHAGRPLLSPVDSRFDQKSTLPYKSSGPVVSASEVQEGADAATVDAKRPPKAGETRSDRSKAPLKLKRLTGQANIDFRELLERFIDVCEAVEYAHNSGVIHRDLKPKNVMLGKNGETLLIDWGLAIPKAVSRRNDFEMDSVGPLTQDMIDLELNESSFRAKGTPGYMAPEQYDGNPENLDTRTDIYSLGMILYQVLTCRNAFIADHEWNRFDKWALIQKVHSITPDPRNHNSAIPKPLAAICLKAAAARPADRYVSASDLARDVERWLANEPVSVYRETLVERTRRWGRRHRSAVITTIISLISGVTVFGLVQQINTSRLAEEKATAQANAMEARRQRDLAEVNAEAAKASEERLLLALDNIRREKEIAETERIKAMNFAELARAKEDEARRQEAAAIVQKSKAERNEKLADVMADMAKSQAIVVNQEISGIADSLDKFNNPRVKRDFERIQQNLNAISLAKFREIQPILEANQEAGPENAMTLADFSFRFGEILALGKNYTSAIEQLEKAAKLFGSIAIKDPATPAAALGQARALSLIGSIRIEQGEAKAALTSLREAKEIRDLLATKFPADPNCLCALGESSKDFAATESDPAKAVDSLIDAIEFHRKALFASPANSSFREKLLSLLGTTTVRIRTVENREILYPKLIAQFEELKRRFPDDKNFNENRSVAYNDFAWLIAVRPDRMPEQYLRAIDLARNAVSVNPSDGLLLNTLGVALYRSGSYAEALGILAKSLESNKKASEGRDFPFDLAFIAMAQMKLGQIAEAQATYARLAGWMANPPFVYDADTKTYFDEARRLIYPGSTP